MDFLKSAVASAISKGPLGGYAINERVDVENSIWTLNNAVKREGNVKCSIFTFDVASSKSRLPAAKNAVRKSRTLHHPGVIKVLETFETDTQIHIVTERLTPLSPYLRRKAFGEETKKWGLCSIAKTIKFINEEASSVHGCIRSSSIFTSESGEWKLGGFELLSSMKEEDAVIYTYSSVVPDSGRYAPPEVSKSGWDAIKRSAVSAVDSYGYGILISEVFNGPFAGTESISQVKSIPPTMQQPFKRLVNPNPKARLSVAQFLEQGRRNGSFFQTPLINLTEGIDSLGLKSDGEREEFLGELNEVAQDFPENYMTRKILPELLKSVEFGGGGAKVFAVVLQIGSKLSEEDYETQITPVIIRLFASPDRAIRVCLLDNLPLMIDRLSQKLVNDKVFPNLVTGFTDMAPVIREQTVKAVLTVVTKLSDRTINGELLKYLAKTANDEQPGIRTNTTICLGKIAKYLGPNTRSKVLVAAFTRSLRDPFVHARNAALMALGATLDMFGEEDCANKILPAICPSLLDKEKLVRDQANRTLDLYLARIRKHGQSMADTAIPAGSATAASNSNSRAPTPHMGAPANDSSWSGWAISSFTNKLAGANGQIQPKANGAPSVARANQVRIQPGNTATATTASTEVSRRTSTSTAPPAEDFDDAAEFWNDDAANGWGGMASDIDDADDADATADAFFETASRSSSASKPSAPTFDDQGEPDFAGWLQAQQTKAKKGPLPKGLGAAKGMASAKAAAAASPATAARAVGSKPVGAGRVVGGVPAKKPSVVVQKKEEVVEDEEGWGDAWE